MILMSNNQWNRDKNSPEWEAIGDDCSAEARMDGLVQPIIDVMPDVVGLQEVSAHMGDLFKDRVRELVLADGSVAKYEYLSGGYTPIIYRRDKLLLLENGFYRFPESVPGYEGKFNDAGSKGHSYGVFQDRTTGKIFAVMTTHMWWKSSNPQSGAYLAGSDEARAYQMNINCKVMDKIIEKYNCPGVILGDYNARMDSYALNVAQLMGWREVHDLAVGDCDDTRGHHPCGPSGYKRVDMGIFAQAIDHIMMKNYENVTVNHFRRVTDEYFDRISDHYPLYIDITL